MKSLVKKMMAVLSPIPVTSFFAYADNDRLGKDYEPGLMSFSQTSAVLSEGNVVLHTGRELLPDVALLQEDDHRI